MVRLLVGGYDSAGNPKYSYLQWIDGIYFEDGRLQAYMTHGSQLVLNMMVPEAEYQELRLSRIVAEYVWDGNSILSKKSGIIIDLPVLAHMLMMLLQYYYDKSNNIVGFDFNGAHYLPLY